MSRTHWSPDEWREAILDLPEEDRWMFSQVERRLAQGSLSRTAQKRLCHAMTPAGRSLASSWIALRPDLGDRCLEVAS